MGSNFFVNRFLFPPETFCCLLLFLIHWTTLRLLNDKSVFLSWLSQALEARGIEYIVKEKMCQSVPWFYDLEEREPAWCISQVAQSLVLLIRLVLEGKNLRIFGKESLCGILLYVSLFVLSSLSSFKLGMEVSQPLLCVQKKASLFILKLLKLMLFVMSLNQKKVKPKRTSNHSMFL